MATFKLVDKLLSKAHTIAIGGHRGCGENLLSTPGRVEPAFRENTLASFKQAAALGVNFIEFDVQVTSDGVPVLWHDNAIITQSQDQPASVCEVKDRSLSEFRALVQGRGADSRTQLVRTFRNRETRQHTAGLVEWRCANDDSLPTLEQLFQVMPECVGFDVEVKMTVPDTVLATSEEEVTRVVIPIVQCVEAMANSNRNIVYSSFDPDVCIKLAQLQCRHEVFYLSGCGIYPHVDPRRTSVSTALEFAAHHRLAGVVVPASILMSNQELVGHAHAKGLKVLTYGLENNSKAAVERQQELGVHAAIVDDVENTLPDLIRVAYEEEEAMGTYGVGIVA